jgi:hypothetical protein
MRVQFKTTDRSKSRRFCVATLGFFCQFLFTNTNAQPLDFNTTSAARTAIAQINQREAAALSACTKEFQTNACQARVKQQFSQERSVQQQLIVSGQRAIREERARHANERVYRAQTETKNKAKTVATVKTDASSFAEALTAKPRLSDLERANKSAKAQQRFEAKQKRIAQRAIKREKKLSREPRPTRQ